MRGETWKAEELLPAEVNGRAPVAPPRVFGPDDLYKYMNGGAAQYLAYGFRELAVASYPVGSGGDEIVVEIYRMGRSEDAFGIYSDGAEGEHPAIGQDACHAVGLLRFWKGTAFVRVLALSEESEFRGAILQTGAEIAARIPEAGRRPRLLRALPPEGLVADRVTYFHTVVSLNHLYYLSDGNPLGLGPETEAVFAEYEIDGAAPRLLLIRYPDGDSAAAASESFETVYLKDRPARREAAPGEPRIELLENDLAMGVLRVGRLLALCFECEPPTAATLLAESAKRCAAAFGEDKEVGGGS